MPTRQALASFASPPDRPVEATPPSLLLLLRQAWSGSYTVQGDSADADCAIGFAFGAVRQGPAIRPGVSNTDLARFAHANLGHLPLILQWELADAYGDLPRAHPLFRIHRHRQAEKYLDTYEVALQARQIMELHGWRTAALLAHGHHLPRATRLCQSLGLQTVVPPGLGEVRFCPESCQWWTRTRLNWWVREVGVMVYSRFWNHWI